MKTTELYLDLSDLYHRVNRRYGRKINFAAVRDHFKADEMVAFGIQRGNEASGFITCLQRLGYETRFKYPEIIRCGDRELKRANWDVEFTLSALSSHDPEAQVWARVILGTGSNNYAPLVRFMQNAFNLEPVIFACNPGKELLKTGVEVIEITEAFLE